MRIFIIYLIFIFQCFTLSSCEDWSLSTCSSSYDGTLRIEGEKGEKVSIQYIGPKEKNYEYEKKFDFNSSENELPFSKEFSAYTICQSKSFKKNDYNFIRIKNLGTKDIYCVSAIIGAEIVEKKEEMEKYFFQLHSLLEIYNREDKDPIYDYTKDKQFKDIKYIDRYELYEKLLKEKYPYIIKLPPQKTCIMKWGGLGFKIL